MPDRKYQKLAFLVELIMPDDFTIEQTRQEIENSIQFGRRIVTFRSQIRNYREVTRVAPDTDTNGTVTKE